jgi:hypothetical protein
MHEYDEISSGSAILRYELHDLTQLLHTDSDPDRLYQFNFSFTKDYKTSFGFTKTTRWRDGGDHCANHFTDKYKYEFSVGGGGDCLMKIDLKLNLKQSFVIYLRSKQGAKTMDKVYP